MGLICPEQGVAVDQVQNPLCRWDRVNSTQTVSPDGGPWLIECTRLNLHVTKQRMELMLKVEEAVASGLSYGFNEDQKMLRDLARDFASNEILPRAEHYDQTDEWPWEIFHKAREVGLVNLNVPEEYGGLGASVLEECIIGQ